MSTRSSTNPPGHKDLPDLPPQPKNTDGIEKAPETEKKANDVALAKLRQKNRQGNRMIIEIPLTLHVESATTYSLSGFTPDADSGRWIVDDVCHSFKGKGGSTTTISLYKDPGF